MTASERGVVMINRGDDLQLARRLAGPSASAGQGRHFSTVRGGANDFFAVARGPLLLRGKAYWVKDGKLVRRALDNSTPLEILASDARNGTRVVGADLSDAPAHAAYISNPVNDDAPPRAKLWVEGGQNIVLLPRGRRSQQHRGREHRPGSVHRGDRRAQRDDPDAWPACAPPGRQNRTRTRRGDVGGLELTDVVRGIRQYHAARRARVPAHRARHQPLWFGHARSGQ